MILRKLLATLLVINLLIGCDDVKQNDELNNDTTKVIKDSGDTATPPAKEKTGRKSEETAMKFSKEEKAFLSTFDTLSLGKSFAEVKKGVPAMSDIKPEGGMSQEVMKGLSESRTSATILSHPADVEFNYRNDTLYSYYILVTEPDYEKADKLFEYVHQHYSKKYGECKKEKVEEENRFIRNCAWQVGKKFMSMTYNVNSGTISWGYQDVNPL
jgi:hypothetical protein